jgi:SAM-dependent methyltransferase
MIHATEPVPVYESEALLDAMGPELRPGGLELTREAVARWGLHGGSRVLDIGCGYGGTLALLTESFGFRAVGLDRSALLLARAGRSNPSSTRVRGEAGALPLAGGSLDGVLLECVLSLVADPDRTLAECGRVLKPGGHLAVSDLFTRNPCRETNTRAPAFCLGGAVHRDTVLERVRRAGFTGIHWEDRTDLLRETAARLVFEHGSTEAFRALFCTGSQAGVVRERIRASRPGYFLLLARKPGRPTAPGDPPGGSAPGDPHPPHRRTPGIRNPEPAAPPPVGPGRNGAGETPWTTP